MNEFYKKDINDNYINTKIAYISLEIYEDWGNDEVDIYKKKVICEDLKLLTFVRLGRIVEKIDMEYNDETIQMILLILIGKVFNKLIELKQNILICGECFDELKTKKVMYSVLDKQDTYKNTIEHYDLKE